MVPAGPLSCSGSSRSLPRSLVPVLAPLSLAGVQLAVQQMTLNDDLSSVAGWMSIACWVIVYTPQIYENYQLKSGEGLSIPLVYIWLVADLCDLFGAVLAGLIPTVIILALYYILGDIILLAQVYYYRWTQPTYIASAEPTPDEEQAPLLKHPAPEQGEPTTSPGRKAVVYSTLVCFVLATGVIGWYLNRSTEVDDGPGKEEDVVEWKSQIMGWCSAVLYLASICAQISKNRQTKCEGLSLALFIFAVAGNATFVLSICIKSMSSQHLIANSSWLAGSGLTIFLDFIVLGQFFYYRKHRTAVVKTSVVEVDSEED